MSVRLSGVAKPLLYVSASVLGVTCPLPCAGFLKSDLPHISNMRGPNIHVPDPGKKSPDPAVESPPLILCNVASDCNQNVDRDIFMALCVCCR